MSVRNHGMMQIIDKIEKKFQILKSSFYSKKQLYSLCRTIPDLSLSMGKYNVAALIMLLLTFPTNAVSQKSLAAAIVTIWWSVSRRSRHRS